VRSQKTVRVPRLDNPTPTILYRRHDCARERPIVTAFRTNLTQAAPGVPGRAGGPERRRMITCWDALTESSVKFSHGAGGW
jgi:hypothetical protein